MARKTVQAEAYLDSLRWRWKRSVVFRFDEVRNTNTMDNFVRPIGRGNILDCASWNPR